MKKIVASLFLVAAALMMGAGCSSVEVGQKFNGIGVTPDGKQALAQITYSNYGFYLLNCVPIFTGAVSDPGSFALFKDTVTTDYAMLETTRRAGLLGGSRMININVTRGSQFNWYTLLIWTRSINVSGTVLE
ncbi:MAG: hypothetical protein PHI85_05235 [Victivallaceae bacterium]|nr:hypothetical protein [Victivallaceae bacterium]